MFMKSVGAVALLQLLSVGGSLAHPGGAPRLMTRGGFVDINDLMPLKDRLVKRATTPDGSCGGTNGYTCGTDVNKCCSQFGFCGDTDLHCQTSENCQAAFGQCITGGSTNGRCGAQGAGAVCASGQCCSEGGFCGSTADFCMAPLCQVGFGKCDADATPGGGSTEGVARPQLGSTPYGEIYDCINPGDIALTYDDGPDKYTDEMVNLLNSYGAKATFFITGVNNGKGAIDITPAWSTVIQKMYAAGHQLASHTWSHADLSLLTEANRRQEMYKLEMAMRNILGFFPTYMRPPFSSCTADCLATMKALGYHVVYFDLDTDDYNQDTPDKIQVAKNNFANAVNPSNPAANAFLAIAHDIHEQTARNLTGYMLDTLTAKGYKAVTVGECLGDPKENWYRAAGTVAVSSSSSIVSSSTVVSSSSSTVVSSSATSSSITSSSASSASSSATSSSVTSSSTTSSSATSSSASSSSVTPSSTSSAPTSSSTACVYKVGDWCPPQLPTYASTQGCWEAVDACWKQSTTCWSSVPDTKYEGCYAYQTVCQTQENHCAECAENRSCRNLKPVYPPNIA